MDKESIKILSAILAIVIVPYSIYRWASGDLDQFIMSIVSAGLGIAIWGYLVEKLIYAKVIIGSVGDAFKSDDKKETAIHLIEHPTNADIYRIRRISAAIILFLAITLFVINLNFGRSGIIAVFSFVGIIIGILKNVLSWKMPTIIKNAVKKVTNSFFPKANKTKKIKKYSKMPISTKTAILLLALGWCWIIFAEKAFFGKIPIAYIVEGLVSFYLLIIKKRRKLCIGFNIVILAIGCWVIIHLYYQGMPKLFSAVLIGNILFAVGTALLLSNETRQYYENCKIEKIIDSG